MCCYTSSPGFPYFETLLQFSFGCDLLSRCRKSCHWALCRQSLRASAIMDAMFWTSSWAKHSKNIKKMFGQCQHWLRDSGKPFDKYSKSLSVFGWSAYQAPSGAIAVRCALTFLVRTSVVVVWTLNSALCFFSLASKCGQVLLTFPGAKESKYHWICSCFSVCLRCYWRQEHNFVAKVPSQMCFTTSSKNLRFMVQNYNTHIIIEILPFGSNLT